MARSLLAGGLLAVMVGAGLSLPVAAAWLEQRVISNIGIRVVSTAGVLIVCGLASILIGFRRWNGFSMPAPVRAAVTSAMFFLAFCALELSDGLVRQGGRVFYWTTVLFLPVFLLLCGLVFAKRWAWWTSRGMTAILTLWFVGFTALIPFVDLRSNDGPVPFWGRMYMVGVSLAFAAIAAYAFRALGQPEARRYFVVVSPFR
ncbi:MAG: hypothetical protein HY000_18425 [Planctomycetes bacterium]|nr:hypothetical protein [Planctomycetota bacterium]